MKSRELIALLRTNDPDGETEVVIDNMPIYSVVLHHAFEEGCLEKLTFDDEFRVASAEITTDGYKIVLSGMPIENALIMNPEMDIKLNISNNFILGNYVEQLAKWRENARVLFKTLKGE